MKKLSGFIISLLLSVSLSHASEPSRIGSKIFTEGYILSEILAVHLEKNNFSVQRLGGLGATGVTEAAMQNKEIDLIVDYTGGIAKSFLKENGPISIPEINQRLQPLGFEISNSLGFNNTYALAVRKKWAEDNQVKKISDLKKMNRLEAAFTPEFTSRNENWINLRKVYGLNKIEVFQMDHQLAYESIKNENVQVIEAYSTDAKLREYDLVTLEDDLNFFPNYEAVIMTHLGWKYKNPEQWKVLKLLEGQITENQMIQMNGSVDLDKKSFNEVASSFLNVEAKSGSQILFFDILKATQEHLVLVIIPVFIALIIGLPLAYVSYKIPQLQSVFGSIASIFQTVPSLAFLTLLIPLFGIGTFPAIIVLSLYAILPIFISSLYGFKSIPETLHLTCYTLKLNPTFKLLRVEFPLALSGILAGVQTALITTVATATLAALIGSGGYGKKIIAGLAVNDMNIVLSGAIPSALMALIFQLIFHKRT